MNRTHSSNSCKNPLKNIAHTYIYYLHVHIYIFITEWFRIRDLFKSLFYLGCYNSFDVTYFKVNGIWKFLISQKQIMAFPWNEKILQLRLRFTFSEAILSQRRYRWISLIFLFLDLVWNSVIYDIAFLCKNSCNANLKCLSLRYIPISNKVKFG